MIKAKITNRNGKTFVAEFPCDVRNFYNGMSSIGVTELMRQINITDAEDSPVKVKLYADNDIGNHLLLLFTEQNNLDDVHLATYLLTSVNKQVQSELEQQIINDQYDSLEKLYQDTGAIRSSTSLGSIGVSAGGISGENNSQIKNCFNIGTVSARSSYGESAFAGGIVGTQIGGATISCYNAGVLTKLYGDYIGAIAGHYSGGNFENCYYHENMSSSYGVGAACGQKLKQEQMIKQQSFVGFDFDTVWTMAGNTDYLYPELKNVPMHFDKKLESIEVTTLPTKLEYLEGKDTLDVTGGKLKLTYNNGTSEVIDLTPNMVSGFDNTQVGPQTLTVTYKGKITTFEVEIVAKSLESIEVTTLPMVKASALTHEAIIEAILAGSFYASYAGPNIYDFCIRDGEAIIETSACRQICLRSPKTSGYAVNSYTDTLTRAEFPLSGNEQVIRAVVTDSRGHISWTQTLPVLTE